MSYRVHTFSSHGELSSPLELDSCRGVKALARVLFCVAMSTKQQFQSMLGRRAGPLCPCTYTVWYTGLLHQGFKEMCSEEFTAKTLGFLHTPSVSPKQGLRFL